MSINKLTRIAIVLEQIEEETRTYIKDHPDEESLIHSLIDSKNQSKDEKGLFSLFISSAQKGNYCLVYHILNHCFENADKRAAFGNKTDEKGNTAYHYAAQNGHQKIIQILNDKRYYKGKQKFFRFNIKNHNNETPLDLACLRGDFDIFSEIWNRAGKSNHNPSHALPYAEKGKSLLIIEEIKKHPKVAKQQEKLTRTQGKKRQRSVKKEKDEGKNVLSKNSHILLFKKRVRKKRKILIESKSSSDILTTEINP